MTGSIVYLEVRQRRDCQLVMGLTADSNYGNAFLLASQTIYKDKADNAGCLASIHSPTPFLLPNTTSTGSDNKLFPLCDLGKAYK